MATTAQRAHCEIRRWECASASKIYRIDRQLNRSFTQQIKIDRFCLFDFFCLPLNSTWSRQCGHRVCIAHPMQTNWSVCASRESKLFAFPRPLWFERQLAGLPARLWSSPTECAQFRPASVPDARYHWQTPAIGRREPRWAAAWWDGQHCVDRRPRPSMMWMRCPVNRTSDVWMRWTRSMHAMYLKCPIGGNVDETRASSAIQVTTSVVGVVARNGGLRRG